MARWIVALIFLGSTAHAGLVCYEYRYAPNLVRRVQATLAKRGLYHGPSDGRWGPKTKAAVHRFQVAENVRLPVYRGAIDSPEGELDEQTLRAMFGEAPEGVTRRENPHGAPSSAWSNSCQ